ncbi:hypothetical protein EDD16DRAFT_150745 [Pisolithus croceorrhizus]|nr:hypothetical protein EDD16DRAFT_150745 [Pisolithus croceorrhizus]
MSRHPLRGREAITGTTVISSCGKVVVGEVTTPPAKFPERTSWCVSPSCPYQGYQCAVTRILCWPGLASWPYQRLCHVHPGIFKLNDVQAQLSACFPSYDPLGTFIGLNSLLSSIGCSLRSQSAEFAGLYIISGVSNIGYMSSKVSLRYSYCRYGERENIYLSLWAQCEVIDERSPRRSSE